MKTIVDWLVLPVNPDTSIRDHFISNEYFPAHHWLIIYNPKDPKNSSACQQIREILETARISKYETLEANPENYYDVLFSFDQWLQEKKLEQNTTIAVNGATNAIPAINAVRDTLSRRQYNGFIFSFKKKDGIIYGEPQITPLNTNTLTEDHFKIIKTLLKLNGKAQSQKELLEHLTQTDEKYSKYKNDLNTGKRVLSYYLRQLKKLNIIKIEHEKNERQTTITLT